MICVLSPEQVVWEGLLSSFQSLVLLPSLLQNDIYDLVVLTDVFCGFGHQVVDYFTE